MTPEQKARVNIDRLLKQAGWHVCDMHQANIHAARGVALREFPLNPGYGFTDYLLYIDGKAAGVIETKKDGATLTGMEVQSARYVQGLPAWVRPLPFSYESTGIETHFTQGLDPHLQSNQLDHGAGHHLHHLVAIQHAQGPGTGGDRRRAAGHCG